MEFEDACAHADVVEKHAQHICDEVTSPPTPIHETLSSDGTEDQHNDKKVL